MLVLTRRKSESLIIGEGVNKVTVTVLEICGNQVRIGIDAPKKVRVDREEIRERIEAEKNEAATLHTARRME